MQSMNLADCARIAKAFSDENRLRILRVIGGGEIAAGNLAEQLDISQSTLSYHMGVLCAAHVVSARRDGRCIFYRLDSKGLNDISDAVRALMQ